jgi:predicted alpha/beta-hydrolase family hydrolase
MKIEWDGGEVSAEWHRAPKPNGTVVVLAHGAGGTMHTPQLKSFADGLGAHGVESLRFNFAYAEARKKAPDRTAILESVYRAAATEARAHARKLIFAGRSMGGRIGSHIAAQGAPCDGLIFLAYPLHPPGKPEKIRDAHLYEIKQPMLFLQGDRDAFADPALLAATLKKLPNATLHLVAGGDHSHKVRGRTPADVNAELVSAAAAWFGTV